MGLCLLRAIGLGVEAGSFKARVTYKSKVQAHICSVLNQKVSQKGRNWRFACS